MGALAVELDVRVVAGEGRAPVGYDWNAGVTTTRAEVDRLYRLGALQYQAALVDRLCDRDAQARRLRRRAAVARQVQVLKHIVAEHFAGLDARLRADCGMPTEAR